MIRLQDNPPSAWPEGVLGNEAQNQWAAIYCKPRQEKALAWDLHRKEVPYFLPMILRETSSGDRRRRNLYPLFPSYLFIGGAEPEKLEALKTNRVVHVVHVSAEGQPNLSRELQALDIALKNFPDSLTLHSRPPKGSLVRVKAGPMAGVEGIVLQTATRHRIWLGVSCLGVGATLEIHPDLVESL